MRWNVTLQATLFSFMLVAHAGTAGAVDMLTTRSLDQFKAEIIARASMKPPRPMVAGMKLADIREALDRIKSLDRDEWARAWMTIGDCYVAEGRKLEAAARIDDAREAFIHAYRYYKFGHYPVDNSPDKKRSYAKGIEAFLAYAKHLQPKLEVVRIPFEGKQIVGYLRLPKAQGKVPLAYFVTALDSRKEEWMERNDDYLEQGVGIFVTDMPGTGEAPILSSPNAERMLSAALDYLVKRPEVDASRIGFYGGSWSGYWAVKMAVVERARLKAVASQGTGVHQYFQPDWQRVGVNTTEYLMDLLPARASVYGVEGLDAFLKFGPQMSLKAQGILDKPSAPLLLVNGSRDTQMPIADLFLAATSLKGGPVEMWVNPEGGHMGNNREWPSQRIRTDVVAPWLIGKLKAK